MDMKQTDILERTSSRENPFRVPQDYFESLPERVMERIRQEEELKRQAAMARRSSMRWIAAAVVTAVVWAASFALYESYVSSEPLAQDADSEYLEEALDFAMVNNHDIENYLTEAY